MKLHYPKVRLKYGVTALQGHNQGSRPTNPISVYLPDDIHLYMYRFVEGKDFPTPCQGSFSLYTISHSRGRKGRRRPDEFEIMLPACSISAAVHSLTSFYGTIQSGVIISVVGLDR